MTVVEEQLALCCNRMRYTNSGTHLPLCGRAYSLCLGIQQHGIGTHPLGVYLIGNVEVLVWPVEIQAQTRIHHNLAILHAILQEHAAIKRGADPVIVEVSRIRHFHIGGIVDISRTEIDVFQRRILY